MSVNPDFEETTKIKCSFTNSVYYFTVMDKSTSTGLPPEQVAGTIIQAIQTATPEVLPAPLTYRLAVMLRPLFPRPLFWIMSRRAKKQSQTSHLKSS